MAKLDRLFDQYNGQFWNGRKPRYRVRYARLPSDGFCDVARRTILVQRGLTGQRLRRVLLHEMCHIGCPHHGARFQARLLRLAEQGEAWAIHEVEALRQTQPWNAMMRDLKTHIVLAAARGQPYARAAVGSLAAPWGLTAAELLSRAPWVPAAWRNASQGNLRGKGWKALWRANRRPVARDAPRRA
jgi:hypothetical protein